MIIHLEKDQLRQARRRLLTDDVFIIFVDALRQFHHEEYTQLAPAELYLSAMNFVKEVLQLPDIMEGIVDEMDDILDEADNEDEAMLIMMVAAAIFYAVGRQNKAMVAAGKQNHVFDAELVMRIIFRRWADHPPARPRTAVLGCIT